MTDAGKKPGDVERKKTRMISSMTLIVLNSTPATMYSPYSSFVSTRIFSFPVPLV